MTPVPMLAGSSDVTANIELYDSDIKKITDGPLEWYNTRSGSWRDVDDVHKGLEEQFHKIGLNVNVGIYTMGECKCSPSCPDADACRHLVPIHGAYIFRVTILSRMTPESGFDFDRMKHEVRNNLLDIKGEGGTMKFDEKEFLRKHAPHRHHH